MSEKKRFLDPDIKIKLPNMMLVPILSLVCAFIKTCFSSAFDWITALVIVPIMMYVLWCLFFMMIAFLTLALSHVSKEKKEDEQ